MLNGRDIGIKELCLDYTYNSIPCFRTTGLLFVCMLPCCHVAPHSDLVSELKFISSSLFCFNLHCFQSAWHHYNLLINKSISISDKATV